MTTRWGLRSLVSMGVALLAPVASAAGLKPLAKGAVQSIRLQQPNRVAAAQSSLRAERNKLLVGGETDFQPRSALTDQFGETHVRFDQLYRGVKVWGGSILTHTGPNGEQLRANDQLVRGAMPKTTPVLKANDALSIAAKSVPRANWMTPGTTELIIFPKYEYELPDKPLKQINAEEVKRKLIGTVLAYHVHTESLNGGAPHADDFIIDANRGQVLQKWNSLQTAASQGPGQSQYSGTVTLDTNDLGTGTFEMRDVVRPAPGVSHPIDTGVTGNLVVNMNFATSGWGTAYTNSTDTWGDGANFNDATDITASTHGETAGVDALYGLQKTWDYYVNVHGRNGVDGSGTPVISRMHYSTNYDNAFWSDNCFCMTYGDGSGVAAGGFQTLTALDVIGHEVSHGVTAATDGLIYSGESGGLNEANSDINGEMVEFYTKGGGGSGGAPANVIGDTGGDWYIGEDLVPGSALRAMFKPSLDGASPDAWYPGVGNLDVHYSSGPMNRAFFFLAWGASNNSASVTYSPYLPGGMAGIGNDEAAAIQYRAKTAYSYYGADYHYMRQAMVAAAWDLFGFPSAEYDAVQNAFAAINVGWPGGQKAEDFSPPTATLSASVTGETLTVNGSATDDNQVAQLQAWVDSTASQPIAISTQPSFSTTFDVSDLAPGSHTVFLAAWDEESNVSVKTATFTVGTHAWTQLLQSTSFDSATGWTETSTLGGPGDMIAPWFGSGYARVGDGVAVMNGWGATDTDVLSQTVTIPAGANASFNFWLWILTSDPALISHDTLKVQVVHGSPATTTTLVTLSNATVGDGFIRRTFDLTPYAGQTVTVQLTGTENNDGNYTAFIIDDATVRVAAPDTTAPVVTASVSGTHGNIAFTANVSDDITISTVNYLVDGTSVGTKAGPPYVFFWDASTLAAGPHVLTVTATDEAGNVGTSAPVNFVTDNNDTLRNWGFEENANGSPWTRTGASTVYKSSAAFEGAQYLRLNGTIGATTAAITGTLKQTAVALPAGATGIQLGFWLQIYSEYNDPTDPNYDSTGAVHDTITLTLIDGSAVSHTLGTWSNNNMGDGAYHQYTADVTAYAGQSVTIQLSSNQSNGQIETVFRTDAFSLQYAGLTDTVNPTVALSETGSYGTIDFTAMPDDNIGVTKTELYVDGTLVGTQNAAGAYDLAFDSTTLTDGPHTLMGKAYDSSGNVGSSSMTFTVSNGDLVPPTVTADPVTATFGDLALSATASDNIGVVEVDFFIDGAYVGTPSASPYQLTVNSDGLSAGTHTFSAYAFDATGSYSHSDVNFTHVAPTVTVSPSTAWVGTAQSAQFTASVTNATDTSVTWSIDEASAGGTVDASGNYLAPLTAGVFHVRATSNADPTQSAVVTVNVIVVNADINRDGKVDGDDMGLLGSAYGSSTGGPSFVANADLNGDGTIDDTDVNLFLPAFGN